MQKPVTETPASRSNDTVLLSMKLVSFVHRRW
jgi:hypothetical protein